MFQQKVARLTDVPKYIEDNKLGISQSAAQPKIIGFPLVSMNNLIT